MSADKGKSPAEFGPVAKLKMLATAASNPQLSRVELAALIAVADMADANKGIAWPSFATLAERAGTTRRHVKTAVKGLVAGGYLIIAERGNRVRSNRYRIILEPPGGALQNTTPHSDLQSTTVVLSSVTCGALERSDVVLSRAPESFHPNEPKARDGWEGSQAEGGAPRATASRPALARQPDRGSDRFPEFWEAVGSKKTVAQAEQLLAELIADGVEYADVLEGAKRWAAYNAATGGKKRASPLRWLQTEKWRDGWDLPSARKKTGSGEATTAPKAKGEKAKGGKKKPAKARGVGSKSNKKTLEEATLIRTPKRKNPDFEMWKSAHDDFNGRDLDEASKKYFNHYYNCRACSKAAYDLRPFPCSEQRVAWAELKAEQKRLEDWRQNNPAPAEWLVMTEDGQWIPKER